MSDSFDAQSSGNGAFSDTPEVVVHTEETHQVVLRALPAVCDSDRATYEVLVDGITLTTNSVEPEYWTILQTIPALCGDPRRLTFAVVEDGDALRGTLAVILTQADYPSLIVDAEAGQAAERALILGHFYWPPEERRQEIGLRREVGVFLIEVLHGRGEDPAKSAIDSLLREV